jgi:hypothetical protein
MTKLTESHIQATHRIQAAFEIERDLIADALADFEFAKQQARKPTNQAIREARDLDPPLPKEHIRRILGNKNYDNLERRLEA